MVDAQGSFFKDRRSSSEVGYLATCLRRGDSIFLVKFMVVCFCKQSHFCKMQVCDNLCFTMSSLTDELLKIQKKKGQKRVKLLITVTPRILRFVKNTKICLYLRSGSFRIRVLLWIQLFFFVFCAIQPYHHTAKSKSMSLIQIGNCWYITFTRNMYQRSTVVMANN